jgi:cytochrome c peroxidase
MLTKTLGAVGTAALALVAIGLSAPARAATPDELLAAYVKQAGAPASAERGRKFFTVSHSADARWTCAACHGEDPTREGKDTMAEKVVKPLAPSANPARFTDKAKVENYFKLNCKDVVGRECTAGEKADVIAWLLTFKR